jgi:hypothetical protein
VLIRLRYDVIGRSWIEVTTTREISLHGLSLECSPSLGMMPRGESPPSAL